MLNVRQLIELRCNYPLRKLSMDDWIEKINNNTVQEELFFIVPEGFLYSLHNKQREVFEERYNISGVYDLGNPYINTGVKFTLVRATTNSVSEIDIGIFTADNFLKKEKATKKDCFEVPENYSLKFHAYIRGLENWINNGITPDHDKEGKYEYNTIPNEEIDYQKLYPRYYSRQAMDVRNALQKEESVQLSELVDIIRPKQMNDDLELVKRLRVSDLNYPLNINSVQENTPTTVSLEKGDIVISTTGVIKPFLFNIDSNEKIFASPNMAVIKCRRILPEYLYLYLISDTAVYILDSISTDTMIQHLTLKELASLPVVLPTLEDQKYILDFQILSNMETRTYQNGYSRMEAYFNKLRKISKKEEKPERVEDILNIELASKLKMHNEEALRTFLTDDLKELNTCFNGKAYKATLILAGSILEAVLIDWLSELKGHNYFEEDYMITDRRTGRPKRADLIDYINEIKDIERPDWMEEADKAHAIRKKRNLVHAKLCLKSDEVNEQVCRQVIEYLKDVLKTRGVG